MEKVNRKMKVRFICDFFKHPAQFLTYQNYMILGLNSTPDIKYQVEPFRNCLFYKLHKMKVKGIMYFWQRYNTFFAKNQYRAADRVGRYVFEFNDRKVKVVLDNWDDREILDQNALDWSDIYFKGNKWPTVSYPAKVYPLINANGRLNAQKIALLKNLRSKQPEFDLNYMSVIWFWPNDSRMHTLIEHHVRTFETLSRLDCKKHLLAVIPSYWPDHSEGNFSKYLRRLDRAGVPWQRGWKDISSEKLFNSLANSKIVFLRPGNALCISWRMHDLICMGACIVCDGHPYPNWPVPLADNINFVDCHCGIGSDYSIPPIEQYDNFSVVIEDLLSNPLRIEAIKANNREYFDRYAAPEKIGSYIIDTVKAYALVNPSYLESDNSLLSSVNSIS